MYEGCLNVDTWIRANRYLARSLSETPSRACKRFFVSENFSPCQWVRLECNIYIKSLTRFTTNLKGTPWVRDNSFEKWNTPITLSESSASSSSRGISYGDVEHVNIFIEDGYKPRHRDPPVQGYFLSFQNL